jgi:hypothetical protein
MATAMKFCWSVLEIAGVVMLIVRRAREQVRDHSPCRASQWFAPLDDQAAATAFRLSQGLALTGWLALFRDAT